ncbi:hypothetical protein BH24ACT3_BH24ACT3_07600 [soil metagenome]
MQVGAILGSMADEAPTPRVSDADRAAFERQVAALEQFENDDEGTPEWRAAVIEQADADRQDRDIPPLKTEPELHRRARDLGLLL